MLDFFKTMKDSFQGKKKKECFKTGIYHSKAERDILEDSSKNTDAQIKRFTSFSYAVVGFFCIGCFSRLVDSDRFQSVFLYSFLFLTQLLGTVITFMKISQKRISQLEEELAEMKLKLNEQVS